MTVPVNAGTSEKRRTIRVAYDESTGFMSKSGGNVCKGYGAEYLNRIARYTGWKYEYINEPWKDQLADLQEGKVDLICTAQKTKQREQYYNFSSISIGTEEMLVYTRPDNKDIYYQDYENMDGKIVGIVDGIYQNQQFLQREQDLGFFCSQKVYDTDAQAISALQNGDVDMIVLGSLARHDDLRIVDRFGDVPVYFMTGKDDTEILDSLNEALEQLHSTLPDLQEQLHREYYEKGKTNLQPLLTREEAEFVQNQDKPLRIACVPVPPLCYEDESTGELKGIYVSLLNMLQEISGLKIDLKEVPIGTDLLEIIENDQYDFAAGAMYNQEFMENPDVQLTEGFFERNYYLIVSRGTDVYSLDKPTIALADMFRKYPSMQSEQIQAGKYIYADSPDECLDAVADGKADAAVASTYVANYYLQKNRYRDLMMTGVSYAKAKSCMLYKSGMDPLIISIINKSIGCLSDENLGEAARQYTSASAYHFSLVDFFLEYKIQILAGLLFFLILFSFHIIEKRRRTQIRLQTVEKEAYRKKVEIDELTGLLSKEGFYRAGREFLNAHENEDVNILFLNVENFKLINDLFGVQAGDLYLQYLAGIVSQISEKTGSVCTRYESDHFILLTLENMDSLRKITDDFISQAREYPLDLALEISAGVYEIRDKSRNLRIMCDRAHLAADSIKNNHLTSLAVYEDAHRQKLIEEQMVINEMTGALNGKQFKAYFQPKYDMRNDHIIGAEALVRWEHPQKGILPPGVFIPVFEKNGFIGKLDLYIYEETCIFLKQCKDQGLPLYPVSVNLSRVGFYNPRLCEILCSVADKYEIPRKYLELEVTESAYTNDSRAIFSVLEKLQKEGFKILMDDFGSGYSSLNMLKEAPVDEIKLDMRFLSTDDPYGRAEEILHMVIEMGNEMGLSVLAEGVETEDQKDMLREYNCNKAQGYYYARPMNQASYLNLLKGGENKIITQ
ncbi:MAG: EAL domain-containing protein [Clostridia bacterium]|nr:EAL domain-containing protein [Clostridia bacterium]MDY5554526.1 EAL domain-containing protein [Blautia sp.]